MSEDQAPLEYTASGKLKASHYNRELARLQEELVKLQYWIKDQGLKVCVIFEGRDAAGKGREPGSGQAGPPGRHDIFQTDRGRRPLPPPRGGTKRHDPQPDRRLPFHPALLELLSRRGYGR